MGLRKIKSSVVNTSNAMPFRYLSRDVTWFVTEVEALYRVIDAGRLREWLGGRMQNRSSDYVCFFSEKNPYQSNQLEKKQYMEQ